jgi:hypothetical protein
MRNVFPPQMSIGQRDIAEIQIDVSSRDDISGQVDVWHRNIIDSVCALCFNSFEQEVRK